MVNTHLHFVGEILWIIVLEQSSIKEYIKNMSQLQENVESKIVCVCFHFRRGFATIKPLTEALNVY